jgi:hypothetical protein
MSICQTCAFNIRGPTGEICGEGLNTHDITYCDSYLKGNNRDIKPISHLKDIILNPFMYWDKVPRYVRGILSHKYLVMTDVGLAIFSNPSWLVPNKDKNGWLICPRLIKYLKNYKSKCPQIDIYFLVLDSIDRTTAEYSVGPDYHYHSGGYIKKDLSIYTIVSHTSLNDSVPDVISLGWRLNGDLKPNDYKCIKSVGNGNFIIIPLLLKQVCKWNFIHELENINY